MPANEQLRKTYVVDDDEDVRLSLTLELKAAGLAPQPFPSADSFLDALDTLPPGCVLLDVRMPGRNGTEMLEELARRGCRWPVIMMTGHADERSARQALSLGAIAFLAKPFSEQELHTALDKGLSLLGNTSK